jgi:DNA polymerase-3 subunit epsilon
LQTHEPYRFPAAIKVAVLNEHLVFLDLETTGATANFDRITEIGMIEVHRGRLLGEWSTLVNPGMRIPSHIQALTGISDAMVAKSPRFADISDELYRRLEGKLLIAHNARFDYGFLRNEFQRTGVRYNSRVLCTVKLSRRLFPQHQRHNLDTLMSRHGISCEARHRALGDARVLWQLMQQWHHEVDAEKISETVGALVKTPTVPAGLPDNIYDGIPETPGVYLFYGDNDIVLYVGKSVNMRSRVMSHFSGDHRVSKDMRIAQQIRRIDWIATAGELGALLQESRLIKQLAPAHNHQLRHNTELCAWHWRTDAAGQAPQMVTATDIDVSQIGDLYGLFRSRRSAITALRDIAAAHELCPILLGLEKRKGAASCFAHQIERCRGACIGAESTERHALRLSQALTSTRLREWPYSGRIGVRETSANMQSTELHVLDRWCYLGTARTEHEMHELAETRPQPVFELDTYKILARFLSKPRRGSSIVDFEAARP